MRGFWNGNYGKYNGGKVKVKRNMQLFSKMIKELTVGVNLHLD